LHTGTIVAFYSSLLSLWSILRIVPNYLWLNYRQSYWEQSSFTIWVLDILVVIVIVHQPYHELTIPYFGI